ncbi:MAG: hypothetical protein AAF682_18870 [Planctomycetota bacterium]
MQPNSKPLSRSLLALVLALAPLAPGCATVAGTAVSPVTGGVDLTRFHMDSGGWEVTAPFVFLGGALSGPFVALWNGVWHDVSILAWGAYWEDFDQVFRPFEMIDRQRE